MKPRTTPRPYKGIQDELARHEATKQRLKNLTLTAIIVAFLIFFASWIIPEIRVMLDARARDRYEEVHKIILDGRGPELKKAMMEAVKP